MCWLGLPACNAGLQGLYPPIFLHDEHFMVTSVDCNSLSGVQGTLIAPPVSSQQWEETENWSAAVVDGGATTKAVAFTACAAPIQACMHIWLCSSGAL